MSAAQVIAPSPIPSPVVKSRSRLSSVSTVVNVGVLKRHSVAYIPSLAWASKAMGLPSSGSSSGSVSSVPRPSSPSSLSIATSVTSLFIAHSGTGEHNSKRRSLDKAAERDWQDQAKQVFQLSTVNGQGNFVPPLAASLDKDLVDLESLQRQDANRDFDYFVTTIVNTPPERVRSFLSAESTISPGMFSSPAQAKGRVKRHTISFPASALPVISASARESKQPPKTTAAAPSSSDNLGRRSRSSDLAHSQRPRIVRIPAAVSSSPIPAEIPSTPSTQSPTFAKDPHVNIGSSPPATPRPRRDQRPIDSMGRRRLSSASLQQEQQEQQEQQQSAVDDTKKHAQRKSRAQMSFLTGVTLEEEEEEKEDPFSSMMSTSPVDLVFRSSRSSMDSSSSSSSSVASSPDTWSRRRSSMLSTSSMSAFSPSSVQKDKERILRMNAQKVRALNNFD
ncbi:hypothetical protein B0O80DRAFT_431526 [Mortierella sp. GBAus27b]|nr:hypothetical protein BGX31_002816 [Mortierella sp. GBA43]KAI8345615.1 hypothetical protein B0O80DRAFT_431526 [Mortierella sp. GBAus27b]